MNSIKPVSHFQAALLTVLLIGMAVAGWYAPLGVNWLLIIGMMIAFVLLLGFAMTGRPFGILVNERNLMSLSRFQTVIWTVIVLSAYISFVMYRAKAGVPDALAVPMDWRLWALMGISATSLIGSPLLLASKRTKKPQEGVAEKTAAATNETKAEVDKHREGTLYANAKFEDASFADMFQGDELKNTMHIDLTKLQMFFFTVIIAFCYAVSIFTKMSGPEIVEEFPPLSEGVIALLGISHAGYLVSKGVDHTPVANT